MTTRGYSLAYPQRVGLALGGLTLMLGMGVWVFYQTLGKEPLSWFQISFWIIWFAVPFLVAFRFTTSAREIVVHEGDAIEFVTWSGRTRLMPTDIREVRVTSGRQAQVVVRHSSGTIYLAGAMTDFHQFLSELKEANPGVVLVGC
jgi:hypothetical protein